MTVLAVGLAALAAWFGLGPTDRRGRRTTSRRVRRRPPVRWRPTAATAAGWVAAVTVSTLVAGSAAGAVVAALGIAVITAAWLGVRHHRGALVVRRRREVARAASSLAVQLQAGLVATEALQNAATDWAVLSEGAAAQRLGADPVDVWKQQSRRPGLNGLADLARGWRICARSGAPLAPTLLQIARSLEAEEALSLTVTAELAAPRATSRVMAALPAVGLGLGFAMGGDPVEFLVGSPAGRACLVGGAALAAVGVVWVERIAGRIARQL